MFTFFRRSRFGFTLIELLVVIAIIGILSGIVFTNLQRARERGENAKIAADIAQLQLALGMLHARGGATPYPNTGGTGNFRCLGAGNCLWNGASVPALSIANPAANSLFQSVINPIPSSQAIGETNRFRGYQYASNGTGFRLRWFYFHFGGNRICDPGGRVIGGGSSITLCEHTRP